MNTKNFTGRVSKDFYSIAAVLAWIGYLALAAIVLIVFIDVSGRYFLNRPLPGSYELVLLAMTVVAGLAIMYTAVKGEHVAVDLFVGRIPRRVQKIMQRITSLLGFAAWAVLAIYVGVLSSSRYSDLTTDTLSIPLRPFQLILGVALFLCCLALLIQTFHPVVSEEKGKKEGTGEL